MRLLSWISNILNMEIVNENRPPTKSSNNVGKYVREKDHSEKYDLEDIVKTHVTHVGWLSENVNWIYIQEVGYYLSPIGNDDLHTVTLTSRQKHTDNVVIAKVDTTNAIYSEWIGCCCDTMWHTKNKVLRDIHGRSFPVGDLCEVVYSIEYGKSTS